MQAQRLAKTKKQHLKQAQRGTTKLPPQLLAFSGACGSRAAVPTSEASPTCSGSFVVLLWACFRCCFLILASLCACTCLLLSFVPLGFHCWSEMASSGPVFSFSGTPTITTTKLNWKNYQSWSASVELWFLGQVHHDHLEKGVDVVPNNRKLEWEKLDYQLCVVLWQSVEPDILEILRSFKTCHSFWKKA